VLETPAGAGPLGGEPGPQATVPAAQVADVLAGVAVAVAIDGEVDHTQIHAEDLFDGC